MSTTNDISKLPTWAQRAIKTLEADIQYYKEKARQAEEGDTDIFIQDLLSGNIGLPRKTNIVYELGDQKGDLYLEVESYEWYGIKGIRIRASGRRAVRLQEFPYDSSSTVLAPWDIYANIT